MNYFSRRVFHALILCVLSCIPGVYGLTNEEMLARPAVFPDTSMVERYLIRQVPELVSKFHYEPKTMSADLSSRWFNEYFKRLDPQKIFFLASDLDDFRSYERILCDRASGDKRMEFVKKVYLRLLHRVREYAVYSIGCLSKDVDFSVKEFVNFDRKDVPWCQTVEELREVWRLRVKNSLLVDRLAQEAEAEKKNGKTEPSSVFKRPPIRERLAKSFAQSYEYRLDATGIEILEGFLCAFSQMFDPHTVYWAPESKEDFDIHMRLSLQGIGATLTTKDSYCEIVSLVPGGPADKEGTLKEGDRIVEVQQDGGEPVNVVDMPLNKVVKQIRGPKGTLVHLTIMDSTDGSSKHVTIKRDEVKLKDAEATSEVKEIQLPTGKKARVLVLYLPSFYADFAAMQAKDKNYKSSSRDVRRLLETEIKAGGVDGVVIDFRGNGGGSLADAVALAGLFYESGPVVQTRQANGNIQKLNDTDPACLYDGPLFVMVDKNSASASEIVAAALQDMGRALVIGTSVTHGKGTVQSPLDLNRIFRPSGNSGDDMGSLKLTMAKFYRINGESTQLKGVKSDIIYPSFQDCIEMGEAKLPNAMKWDVIKSSAYNKSNEYELLIPTLRKMAEEHAAKSPAFQEYVTVIREFEALHKMKDIPLEYEARKAYRDRNEEVTKKIRRMTTLSKKLRGTELTKKARTAEELEEEKLAKDVLMDETLYLMGRYLEIRESTAK